MAELTGNLGLFLNAAGSYDAKSIHLFCFGTIESGHFAAIDLFVSGDNSFSNSLNLYLQGPDRDDISNSLNLYTRGVNKTLDGSLDLFLANHQSGVSLSMPLVVLGEGTLEGGLPLENSLNLFLRRSPTAALDLFVQGPGEFASGQIPLFLHGSVPISSGIDLFTEGIGFISQELRLYSHGF